MEGTNEDGFEELEYEDPKKEEAIFEVFKSKDWDTTVPQIIDAIEHSKDDANYGDYPYFKVQNTIKFIPKLSEPSEIIVGSQLKELHSVLPYYHQYCNLKLLYAMGKDGCSIKTLYQKCEDYPNCILLIKDDSNNVFGAYSSEKFEPLGKFYGTGETFIFTFYNGNRIHVFNSSGANEHYIYSDDKQLAFGCSDDYFSLSLTNDFYNGYSRTTQTYNNPPLNGKDNENFLILKLEIWSFQDK